MNSDDLGGLIAFVLFIVLMFFIYMYSLHISSFNHELTNIIKEHNETKQEFKNEK